MKQLRQLVLILFISSVLLEIVGCSTSYEEKTEYEESAEIIAFSVPDSASSESIPVTISAILGRTTASSFKRIDSGRTDSLFQFVVYATKIDKSGEQYEVKDILLDTTLILTTDPERTGLHYFWIYSSTGDTLRDTTSLY